MRVHSTETALAGDRAGTVGPSRIAASIAAAWLMSLGFDVLLHGGLLARLYMEPNSFLLGPADAFRRIPLGYLAFLVLTGALYWLLRRLGVRGAVAGSRYGAVAGAVMWGSFTVGLYSISTATLPLLAGWWIGQTVELGLAGAVLGAAQNGVPMKRIWSLVAVAVVLCFSATIAMQSLGFAPAARIAQ
ncbi:MAG TPA: hypothetical protein VF850_08700 [Gemmatimonadaceae bacterium]